MKRALLLGSLLGVFALSVTFGPAASAQRGDQLEQMRRNFTEQNDKRLAEPFKGVTTAGEPERGLFAIRATGVSTDGPRRAALEFLAALTPQQKAATTFGVDDMEWRKWANQDVYLRQGVSFLDMTEPQREKAYALLQASLSAKGLKQTRDIMRLNYTLGELNDNNFDRYGDLRYHITVMGEPSATEPWGWQLDGHHLNVNYFVMGDQVVMTPAFWGSEPTVATSGKYTGVSILQDEQGRGLQMIRALTPEQRAQATLQVVKKGNNILTQAFSDNVVLDFAGVRVSSFLPAQKKQLVDLMGLYIGNLREGHARVHLSDVEKHLDATWFAWIGGTEDNSVYYYRIHSPVVLIEFDHETPVGLRHLYPPGVPYREHIHSVVRTPNGNDYGKDLLRQHYQRHPH